MKKERHNNCVHNDWCDCENIIKEDYCDKCIYYRWVDSGYGYCIGLPTTTITPWCKDPCALYKKKEEEK